MKENMIIEGPLALVTDSGVQFGKWCPILRDQIGIHITSAKYAKIGPILICTFDITVTDISTDDRSKLSLHGLPFIIEGTGTVEFSQGINLNSDNSPTGSLVQSNTHIELSLTTDDIKVTTRLVGTITYITAS